MKIKLVKVGIILAVISALCITFYQIGQRVGQSEAKVKIVEKQVEVIKYVEKKKADIYSKPNASRKQLLDLMSKNNL